MASSSSPNLVKKNVFTSPTSHSDLIFNPCNHVARLESDPKHSEFDPIASFLMKSPLHYALTYNPPKISKLLIGNFWLTCIYDATSEKVSASILSDPASPDLSFGVEDVRSALHLPTYSPYEKFPLGNEHEEVVAALNYIRGEHDRSPGTLLRKNMGERLILHGISSVN
ncbi:hypothetical protein L6452_15557 [Arctium lappa]|uniref:Uncharacterized protein n=1 Tax=Arctium lappa TaxID=4217 RepID=A0ACB9CP76_ARCLA|nr:hypothetical protein L6452_15557 [Arctium lappa]